MHTANSFRSTVVALAAGSPAHLDVTQAMQVRISRRRIVVHTYRLDAQSTTYRLTGVFERQLDVTDPWAVGVDLNRLRAPRPPSR